VRVVGGLGTVNVGHFSPKNIPDYILVTRARGKRLWYLNTLLWW